MASSGIANPYDSSIFRFLMNLHAVLHRDYTNSHSHQQCKKFPFSPHPLQHLFFGDFLMMAILSSVLFCIFLITNDVEHLFTCLWPPPCLLWRNGI